MLAEPTEIQGKINLIPRSGVQFVDLRLNMAGAGKRSWLFHDLDGQLNGLEEDPETQDLFYFNADGRKEVVAQETFDVGLTDMLGLFENAWLPLPVFREQPPSGFSLGPVNWARARLVPLKDVINGPDKDGNTHHLTLAFDTDLLPTIQGRDYLAPSSEDARAGRQFRLTTAQHFLGDFVAAQWVEEWIFDLFRAREFRRSKSDRKTDEVVLEAMVDRYGVENFHIAAYLAFLSFLKLSGADRSVVFSDVDSDRDVAKIDVDLVLDLGNSRTCGILIESNPDGGLVLKSASELELRDLSRPELIYREPFDSHIEFHRVTFGKDNLSPLSGRSDAFIWPTIVRVGQEASRLAGLREGTGGNTGMSSPKRYLWDTRARIQPWRFNGRGADSELEPYAKDGIFAGLVNREGRARHLMEAEDPENLPPVEAKYSRSSLMSFALSEIFYHTVTMINSPEYRYRRGHYPVPRRLRSIIMTMPTAMTKPERDLLEERAKTAIELTWLCMGLAADAADLPKLEMNWDEASATQLVYLYTEVARTFAGDARAFINLMKRPHMEEPRPGVLRIASIDIGGGTTDLIITDYAVEGAGTAVSIIPDQRFREGFNLAGDDILRKVIDRHVLSVIEAAVAAAGVSTASALMTELFGGDRSETKKAESTLRQQFISQIAIPIGLAILSEYEGFDPFRATDTRSLSYSDVFSADKEPPVRVLQFFENKVIERGGVDFVLRDLVFPVNVNAIAKTVGEVLNLAFSAMCEAIRAYDCDLLLLSGRPSRLPVVLELIRASVPLTPDRIVPLHRYRVGDWYPFRDAAHRIKDPKTTAAVGAMIGAIARGRLPQFGFRSDLLTPKSTTRIIGKSDTEGRIRKEDEYYTNVNLDDPDYLFEGPGIPFNNTMVIGFRQLPIARWPATQLYVLDFADDESANRLRAHTPLNVELSRVTRGRKGAVGETLEIARVTNKDGEEVSNRRLSIRLQTLRNDEGYWIDTGAIR